MPPRYQPVQTTTQRPLHNEIMTLQKLLGTDILEQAARILDHFAATKENKFEAAAFQTPPHLNDKLIEKCEDFETVCDQIYFILEQSKRVLQLEYQQKVIQIKADNLEKERQQQKKAEQAPPPDTMNVDTDMDFESSQMDASLSVDMMETDQPQSSQNAAKESATSAIDEEDMEELLQIQRDRLDRLKNVIVLGMDADAVKANGRDGDKEDLLF
ncbi:uncharacterized protein ATC70_006364 [Mucor velutinosus]|uniref:Uncharacterized protein n=1 Tax=Mucor velutinosus TaxID=708070 RepID=A0AAN7D4H0_9FUNG|nr:hypothetical protein ATC70_006364 [Mucor velutinosus]